MIKQQIKQVVQQHLHANYFKLYKAEVIQKIYALEQALLQQRQVSKKTQRKKQLSDGKKAKNYVEIDGNQEFSIDRRNRIKNFYGKLGIETSLYESPNILGQNGEIRQFKQKTLEYRGDYEKASTAQVFISRVQLSNPLSQIDELIYQEDWMNCKMKKKNKGVTILLLSYETLGLFQIDLSKIEIKSIETFENILKFSAGTELKQEMKHYIFKFGEQRNVWMWRKYLGLIQTSSSNLRQKWGRTSIKCMEIGELKSNRRHEVDSETKIPGKQKEEKIPPQLKIEKIQNFTQRIGLLQNEFNFQYKQNRKFLESRKLKRELKNKFGNTTKTDKFQVKNSFYSEANFYSQHTQENQPETFKTNLNQLDDISIAMEQQGQTLNSGYPQKVDPVASPSRSTIGMQSKFISQKVIQKIEEKSNLLAEMSRKKLDIHWYQQSLENKIEDFDQDVSSPSRYMSSPTREFRQKKESLNSQNTFQSPISIKRVESINCEKSRSRDSESYTETDRKKSDFSIQPERVQVSGQRKKREGSHYLQKLRQKQERKEKSKRSRQNSEKKSTQYILNAQQEERKSLKSIASKYQQNSALIEESISQQNKTQSNSEIAIQELKNGIVLQKWYKKDVKPKIKKLYLSHTTSELCYSDLDNKDQKKYLLKYVTMIQYGKVTQGIAKNRKKGIQQLRCLRIDVNDQGKDKILQFYLPQSQPFINLEHFSEKLFQFVSSHNQFANDL